MAKASAAAVAAVARVLLDSTANPDGPGVLVRGREYQPLQRADFDPLVVDSLVRLARLAESAADALRECPRPDVRRSAAVLAARAHPIRAAFDG